ESVYWLACGLELPNPPPRPPSPPDTPTGAARLRAPRPPRVAPRLADRYGGSRITLWNFVGMGAATGVLIVASTQKSLTLFTVAFVVLFVLTGLGNGSTYKMIPGIFQAKALARGLSGEEAAAHGRRLSGASMGLIGAVGALGGVGINLAFRQSFLSYGSGTGAFVAFLAFYAVCLAVTRAVYLRRPARPAAPTAVAEEKPRLSYAEV
ncbi:MFS transporter, partial [Streptomyces hirsutus]